MDSRLTLEARCIVLAGPATCGKSTLARSLADHSGAHLIEGDDYHCEAWKARPDSLSDAQRAQWMSRLTAAIIQSIRSHRHTVVTCSALTQKLQSQLLKTHQELLLVFLSVTLPTALHRAQQRRASGSHYFHEESLIREQFDLLHLPSPDTPRTLVLEEDSPERLLHAIVTKTNRLHQVPRGPAA